MKKIIKFIKFIVFLIIFYILWSIVFKVLWLEKANVGYFYDEPKNSIDVVYVGSSNVLAHYNAPLAYDLHGFTVSLLATNAQPFSAIKYLLEESKKYQNPELYVIDIARVGDEFSEDKEGYQRNVIDSLKNSKNRIDAINGMLKYTDLKKEDYINYYFSFLLYHNKWKNISKINIVGNETLYKGYLFDEGTYKVEKQNEYQWNNEKTRLKQENKEILEDLLDYIKANKLNVLFVVPSRVFKNVGSINCAISIIQENGFDVINFNTLEDFKVDYSKDFYNSAHLNVWGATKYTKYFSEYLKKYYDLPDHRNDELYNSWENEYIRFKNNYEKVIGEDFENLL